MTQEDLEDLSEIYRIIDFLKLSIDKEKFKMKDFLYVVNVITIQTLYESSVKKEDHIENITQMWDMLKEQIENKN